MNEIRFYNINDPYGFFSNFSPHSIFIDGEAWPTAEHFFQAGKFGDESIRNKIRSVESPMKAASAGRDENNNIRGDWEEIKERIMLKALLAKFLQYPELRAELLRTKGCRIIEHTGNDRYWGNAGDDSGKNRMGELLMTVRNIIDDISSDPDIVLPPWIAFPPIDQFDLFWKMGPGGDYLIKWNEYYLNCADQEKYKSEFPENPDWEGVYD